MSTLAVKLYPLACNVNCSDDLLVVELIDGRIISVPLVWFPKLANATELERKNWEFLGDGEGIHWSGIDEDLSVNGLLAGTH